MDFREELCFRYLNRFLHSGELESDESKNLVGECKKIKGFSTAAGRVSWVVFIVQLSSNLSWKCFEILTFILASLSVYFIAFSSFQPVLRIVILFFRVLSHSCMHPVYKCFGQCHLSLRAQIYDSNLLKTTSGFCSDIPGGLIFETRLFRSRI